MFLLKGLITQINPDETLMCLVDTNGHTPIHFLMINKDYQTSPSSPVCLITFINHTVNVNTHTYKHNQTNTDCCYSASASSAAVSVL